MTIANNDSFANVPPTTARWLPTTTRQAARTRQHRQRLRHGKTVPRTQIREMPVRSRPACGEETATPTPTPRSVTTPTPSGTMRRSLQPRRRPEVSGTFPGTYRLRAPERCPRERVRGDCRGRRRGLGLGRRPERPLRPGRSRSPAGDAALLPAGSRHRPRVQDRRRHLHHHSRGHDLVGGPARC
jgi:hypothetical protein